MRTTDVSVDRLQCDHPCCGDYVLVEPTTLASGWASTDIMGDTKYLCPHHTGHSTGRVVLSTSCFDVSCVYERGQIVALTKNVFGDMLFSPTPTAQPPGNNQWIVSKVPTIEDPTLGLSFGTSRGKS